MLSSSSLWSDQQRFAVLVFLPDNYRISNLLFRFYSLPAKQAVKSKYP
jgi:hypothetical protein